ncbi:MAG: hypothetical protein HY549_00885 [Elusimicrobia bacterium]|nr:hypothetical protein [Elusimicrobiota bacterium]
MIPRHAALFLLGLLAAAACRNPEVRPDYEGARQRAERSQQELDSQQP